MTVLTSVIDIFFGVQFNAEFHRQIMNFPIELNHVPKFLATGDTSNVNASYGEAIKIYFRKLLFCTNQHNSVLS